MPLQSSKSTSNINKADTSKQKELKSRSGLKNETLFKIVLFLFFLSIVYGLLVTLENAQLKKQNLMLRQQKTSDGQDNISANLEDYYDIDKFVPCEYYKDQLKDYYFPKYVVKQGDSLLSIAREQLGDSSKYKLIIWYNNKKYPHLSEDLKNTLLEPGWELVLPPSEAPEDKVLQIISGHVMKHIDGRSWGIVGENYYALGYDLDDFQYDSGEIPLIGDCATIVTDGNLNIVRFDKQ